jgi:hypothetical protein
MKTTDTYNKQTIAILSSLLEEECVKIEQRAGEYEAYQSIISLAKHIGTAVHWDGNARGAVKFAKIIDRCKAVRLEHLEQQED